MLMTHTFIFVVLTPSLNSDSSIQLSDFLIFSLEYVKGILYVQWPIRNFQFFHSPQSLFPISENCKNIYPVAQPQNLWPLFIL